MSEEKKPRERKQYPRLGVVMNDKNYKLFEKKCRKMKYGKSSVVNALIEKWLLDLVSIENSIYVS